MRARLLIFAKLFLFWMIVMWTARFLFLAYNYDLTSTLTFSEVMLAQAFGSLMDASVNGYIVMLSGLLLAVSCLIHGRWLYYALNAATLAVLVPEMIIVIVDLELYRHWGFRMDNTPLFYMGSEAVGSVNVLSAIKVLILGALLMTALGWLYLRWIAADLKKLQPTRWVTSLALLVVTATMPLFIRGSVTTANMNTGFVYFHPTKMFANHAAINVVWNFMKSLSKPHVEYPEDFFDPTRTEQYFSQYHPASDTTFSILRTKKPDVILLLVESYTADVIGELGGLANITPRLNELCREGILFDNFYASGTRTDKGLLAVLSAYPSQPRTIMVRYPHKSQSLPSINRSMRSLGYNTSFLYGGDADFANFRSYLMSSSVESLTEDEDFDSELRTSKWGVHDGFVLQRALDELDTTTSPFFKVILTQSSHEPFDVPMKPLLPPVNDENKFLNSCHYTDSCLGAFIDKLKAGKNWDNTLVILTADHGHFYPGNKPLSTKARFHIPLLFLGGAIKGDSIVHTLGNQTDIANTLLGQLGAADSSFTFSRDLFGNKMVEHTAFYYTDGYGFITPGSFVVYDNVAKKFIVDENASEFVKDVSKAHQQKLYSDFNKR